MTGRRGKEERDEVSIPSPLLESIFEKHDDLYKDLIIYTKILKEIQKEARQILENENRIRMCSHTNTIPLDQVSGVDGTYRMKRTVTADIHVIAAILLGEDAIESCAETLLLPPSDQPARISQGLMTILEVEALLKSNAKLTLYDGSFLTQLIKIHSLYSAWNRNENSIRQTIRGTRVEALMDDFRHKKGILELIERGTICAYPKESASRMISSDVLSKLKKPVDFAIVDKVLLSSILQPGEYILTDPDFGKLRITDQGTSDGHEKTFDFAEDIVKALEEGLRIMYIKPQAWAPAQKIEFPRSMSVDNIDQLASTTVDLFLNPSVIEAYPLFISDRICKAISDPTEAVFSSLFTRLMNNRSDDAGLSNEELQLMFREYRTEV